jgi:hypothetical protein
MAVRTGEWATVEDAQFRFDALFKDESLTD